jgi:tRNA A-37 threonylcarbamoyl transferase component Bud32
MAEFSILSSLEHPSVARALDLGTVTSASAKIATGSLFVTTEFLPGQALDRAFAEVDAAQRVQWLLAGLEQLASALCAVHGGGLIHSDIKPEHILVVRGDGGPRFVLIDFDLSAAPQTSGPGRGTPLFASPEALLGDLDQRSDLYSLGMSFYTAVAGKNPFVADTTAESIRAVMQSDMPSLASQAPWLPTPVAEVIERLVGAEAGKRPSSAAVLIDEVHRIREALGFGGKKPFQHYAQVGAIPLVGRQEALAAIETALHLDESGTSVIAVHGPPGSGRSRLVDTAVRRHQIRAASGKCPALAIRRTTVEELVGGLGVDVDASEDGGNERLIDGILAALRKRNPNQPNQLIVIDSPSDSRCHRFARALAAEPIAGTLLLYTCDQTPSPGSVKRVALDQLSAANIGEVIAAVTGQPASTEEVESVATASGGIAQLVVEGARALARGEEDLPANLNGLLSRSVERLGLLQQDMLDTLAVAGRALDIGAVAFALDADPTQVFRKALDLRNRGWLSVDGARMSMPSASRRECLVQRLSVERLRRLHGVALDLALQDGADLDAAGHRLLATPGAEAVDGALDAARTLRAQGALERALAMCSEAAAIAAGPARSQAATLLAELHLAHGDYDQVDAVVTTALRTRNKDLRRRARLTLCAAQQRPSRRFSKSIQEMQRRPPDTGGSWSPWAVTRRLQDVPPRAQRQRAARMQSPGSKRWASPTSTWASSTRPSPPSQGHSSRPVTTAACGRAPSLSSAWCPTLAAEWPRPPTTTKRRQPWPGMRPRSMPPWSTE